MFGITRQAYYNHRKRGIVKQTENELIIKRVKAVRSVHPRMGCRKIHELLKEELKQIGIKIGRDKLFDLLSDNQLLIRRRKRKTKTTNSYHMFKKYKNLIKDFTPYKAGQLWVSDITYIRNKETFKYLFLITDAYSRKIVGHKIADSLETKHAIESMKMAIKQASTLDGLIHHSDRGVQYCSHKYVKLLQDYKIRISMTEDSNPTDNSIAERINGILKEEYIEPINKTTNIELEEIVNKAIHRYNYYRPHLSCDMKTPNEAHKMTGNIKKRWKNYYTLDNVNN